LARLPRGAGAECAMIPAAPAGGGHRWHEWHR
jgi:hypothetical protein